MKKVLVLCAHPDDETLGIGGTIALHVQKKDKVFVLIFATGQFGRDSSTKGIEKRKEQGKKACKVLGVNQVEFLNYDDQQLETVLLTELTKKIESVINKWKPSIVYTHFWGDVNQDHRRIFEASLIALRPKPNSYVDKIMCFETPSSTEWGSPNLKFEPNTFVNIEKVLSKKLTALKVYKGEIEKHPHPRSKTSVLNRAKYWGSLVGLKYAEPLINVREILRT